MENDKKRKGKDCHANQSNQMEKRDLESLTFIQKPNSENMARDGSEQTLARDIRGDLYFMSIYSETRSKD